MKTLLQSITMLIILAAVSLSAQTLDIKNDELLNLVKELTTKQAQLADNEGKIDSKVIDLAETLRVARISMSRAGGPHIAPPPGSNIPVPRPPPPAHP
jgi:hypothetical protein